MSDFRSELQKAQELWDAALKGGAFRDASRPPTPEPARTADYGMSPEMAGVAANSEKINDVDYWNAIFRISRGEQVDLPLPVSGVLTEGDRPPNPVPWWTRGVDQENEQARCFDLADFERLIKMKEDLHVLGDKLAAAGQGGRSTTLWGKIKGLQDQIGDLSDSLGRPKEEKRTQDGRV